jgi:hypothetical protein
VKKGNKPEFSQGLTSVVSTFNEAIWTTACILLKYFSLLNSHDQVWINMFTYFILDVTWDCRCKLVRKRKIGINRILVGSVILELM